MSNRNAHVLVEGEFNCGDIEWSHMQVPHGVQKRQSQQQLLDIIGGHCLTQVVNIPTRNDKTLDLRFTNSPLIYPGIQFRYPPGQFLMGAKLFIGTP